MMSLCSKRSGFWRDMGRKLLEVQLIRGMLQRPLSGYPSGRLPQLEVGNVKQCPLVYI
jgi:hypothetical protein